VCIYGQGGCFILVTMASKQFQWHICYCVKMIVVPWQKRDVTLNYTITVLCRCKDKTELFNSSNDQLSQL